MSTPPTTFSLLNCWKERNLNNDIFSDTCWRMFCYIYILYFRIVRLYSVNASTDIQRLFRSIFIYFRDQDYRLVFSYLPAFLEWQPSSRHSAWQTQAFDLRRDEMTVVSRNTSQMWGLPTLEHWARFVFFGVLYYVCGRKRRSQRTGRKARKVTTIKYGPS
jgi:hypothetical protein